MGIMKWFNPKIDTYIVFSNEKKEFACFASVQAVKGFLSKKSPAELPIWHVYRRVKYEFGEVPISIKEEPNTSKLEGLGGSDEQRP